VNNPSNTGEFLKSLRISKGLTQIELAEYLNVSNKTVSKWENGIGIPEVATLIILADFYEVSVDDILRGTKRVSKNIEKEAHISSYVVSRIKNSYINYLIVSIGLWLLSNVTMIGLGEITSNSTLGIGISMILVIIGLVIQGININYLRLQVKEIDTNEKNKILNYVFNSSFIYFYLSISTVIFAGFYNVGSSMVLSFEFVIYRFIYSYSLMAIRAILVYYIIRIFRISFLNKLNIRWHILNGSLFAVLFIPFLIITIFDSYDLAIKTDNSYVSFSIANKDENPNRFYQLKFLSLIGRDRDPYLNDRIIYNEETNQLIYTFDDGFELIMSNETHTFITSIEYVRFDIDDYQAIGYMIDLSKTEMGIVLYSNFMTPVISLWGIGWLFYFFVLKDIKKKKYQ
jgi:transcriptional regulator with XRE-family HTH domain